MNLLPRGRAPAPSEALDQSMETGPTGDSRSVDPSKAPEQLHDLFNREGAVSRCTTTSPGAEGRITLPPPLRGAAFKGSHLVTASQLGFPWSICVIISPQRCQLCVLYSEYQGLHDPLHRPTAVVLHPVPLLKVFLLLRRSPTQRDKTGSPDRRGIERL
jgi:hypothetical protein